MSFINKTLKRCYGLVIVTVIIFVSSVLVYIFCHSTPERAIREDLFKQGYFIGAFNTKIYKSRYDEQYGQSYSCKQPVIGPDFYSVTKENGLWYINHDGTGGG